MSKNNQVTIKVETIQEIIKELSEISNNCSTPHLKVKVDKLQKLVSSFIDFKSKVSLEDMIYDKMVEAKNNNQDLHLKLYMLYRNLTSGRISETDAMAAYESYLSMFPADIIVY